MGLRLQFEIDGVKQVSAELGIRADGVKDFREPLERTASALQKSFQMNFDARGGLFMAAGWPPRSQPRPWPLLEKTGRLRRSFRDRTTKTETVLTNLAPYFRFHQRGTAQLPQRILMKIDEARRNQVFKFFQEYLVSLGRRAR